DPEPLHQLTLLRIARRQQPPEIVGVRDGDVTHPSGDRLDLVTIPATRRTRHVRRHARCPPLRHLLACSGDQRRQERLVVHVPRRTHQNRSEERRVGKECRYRWSTYHQHKKTPHSTRSSTL